MEKITSRDFEPGYEFTAPGAGRVRYRVKSISAGVATLEKVSTGELSQSGVESLLRILNRGVK